MPQILVIDDEENYALMLQNLLEERGFKTQVTTHPKDAYELLKKNNYSLIVSDYRMPLMDGAAFLKKVRGLHPRLPVFLVSGVMNTAELVKVANLGATRVYEKPLDAEVFVGQVLQFVEPEADMGNWDQHPIESLKKRYSGQHKAAYGNVLSMLSDQTPCAVRWIEQLFYAWQQSPQLLLVEPVGGEGTLAVHEMERWEGFPRETIVLDSLDDLSMERITTRIQRALLDDGPPLSLGIPIQRQIEADELAMLQQVIDSQSGAESVSSKIRITLVASRNLPSHYLDAVEAHLSLRRVVVPELSGRFADIIFYLRMHSEQWLPTRYWPHEYESSLSSRLLAYSWPGNVEQISQWLRYLSDVKPALLDETAFDAFLEHIGLPVPHAHFNLEHAMVEQQRRLLIDAADAIHGSVLDVLGGMGFDTENLPEGVTEDDFELLFPQVLSSES